MRIFKKGFTLAELLLVIGIIGIVSAMGASITKKTTQKAYDLYWYTGFVNLYDALVDTEMNTGHTETNKVGGGNCSINILAPICHVNNLLGTTAYDNSQKFTIVTKNGITYEFNGNNDYSHLLMGVPQPKTRANNEGRAYAAIKFNSNAYDKTRREFIIPVDPKYFLSGEFPAERKYISLGDRKDLLPAYLDNGMVGRIRTNITTSNSNIAYDKIAYYTYNQVLCSYINAKHPGKPILGRIDGGTTPILDCSTIQNIPQYNDGVIKFANPQKIK